MSNVVRMDSGYRAIDLLGEILDAQPDHVLLVSEKDGDLQVNWSYMSSEKLAWLRRKLDEAVEKELT